MTVYKFKFKASKGSEYLYQIISIESTSIEEAEVIASSKYKNWLDDKYETSLGYNLVGIENK